MALERCAIVVLGLYLTGAGTRAIAAGGIVLIVAGLTFRQ